MTITKYFYACYNTNMSQGFKFWIFEKIWWKIKEWNQERSNIDTKSSPTPKSYIVLNVSKQSSYSEEVKEIKKQKKIILPRNQVGELWEVKSAANLEDPCSIYCKSLVATPLLCLKSANKRIWKIGYQNDGRKRKIESQLKLHITT